MLHFTIAPSNQRVTHAIHAFPTKFRKCAAGARPSRLNASRAAAKSIIERRRRMNAFSRRLRGEVKNKDRDACLLCGALPLVWYGPSLWHSRTPRRDGRARRGSGIAYGMFRASVGRSGGGEDCFFHGSVCRPPQMHPTGEANGMARLITKCYGAMTTRMLYVTTERYASRDFSARNVWYMTWRFPVVTASII